MPPLPPLLPGELFGLNIVWAQLIASALRTANLACAGPELHIHSEDTTGISAAAEGCWRCKGLWHTQHSQGWPGHPRAAEGAHPQLLNAALESAAGPPFLPAWRSHCRQYVAFLTSS